MPTTTVGPLLRTWRERRRLSQLELAGRAGVSARHLSFLETGRSKPSREMVLHLAEELDVPLRERNSLLAAAGFAAVYPERTLDAPEMQSVREAIDLVLAAHEPYPAVVVDRHWTLVGANGAIGVLVEGVAEHLLAPPANVLRASLHPQGLAPRIANLEEWSAHVMTRLRRQVELTGDIEMASLYDELRSYPGVVTGDRIGHGDLTGSNRVVVTLRLIGGAGDLSFFSTVTTFGTAVDITVAELAVEAFFPADASTAAALRAR